MYLTKIATFAVYDTVWFYNRDGGCLLRGMD